MSSISKLLDTDNTWTTLLTRVVVGSVMFAHGAQKMLAWFGGHGPAWTVEKWNGWFALPPLVTWVVIAGEFFGALALLAGFASRIMAMITILIMFGALYYVHFKWGFFMNWYGETERGEGFEYHLLMITLCVLIVVKGSGKWSIDGLLWKK